MGMPYKAFDLAGRVAIVTGAGRGLGRGMALALAQSGATVVAAGRSMPGIEATSRQIRDDGGASDPFLFDAVKREECRKLVAETVARHGKLDTFVINHGVAKHAPAVDVLDSQWQETIAVNLTSAFLCAQAAGKHMIEQRRGGSIIFISSTASMVGFNNLVSYGSSKGGVDQLCRQLAVEWGPHNIRVNAVNPGYTVSDMAGTEARHADSGLNEEVNRMTPLGRRATIEEIAGPVVFLASEAASFVSGICLAVDGGYCAR
jgi:NAD(P)-dependent dehydrogenase (short-subunit alcohol dehydrogenase family)